MPRKLPPFASLRAFEAAARHCSFKKASGELLLTPSAVSHQIRSLEDYLGTQLFHRRHKSLYLTEPGQDYLQDLTELFDRLEGATARVAARREDNSLTINLFPSLASMWLLTRLPQFRAEHPDLNVRLMTSNDPVDFTGSDVDMTIRYERKDSSPGQRQGKIRREFLFDEVITPICSPAFLETHGPFSGLGDLLRHPLIYCDVMPEEWPDWFREAGVAYEEPAQRINLDSRGLAIKAAVDGLGIAMGRNPYHDDDFRESRLVAPFPYESITGYGYFLCYPGRDADRRTVRAFGDWLKAVCGG